MKIDVKGAIISNEDAWVYDYFGLNYCCPKKICEAVEKANGEELDVYINSSGGDIFSGSEIYETFRSYAGRVKIHVTGLAASAASVIACAAPSDIAPTAMFMIHNVSSGTCGDYHAHDKESKILQSANKAISAAYQEKTKKSESELLKLMDKETWLTAQEAVELGFIDTISTPKVQLTAQASSEMIPQAVIDRLRNQLKPPGSSLEAKIKAKMNLLKMEERKV